MPTRSESTLNRRRLLQGGLGLLAVASLPGCGFFDTKPAGSGAQVAAAGEKESPMLKALVDKGSLPALADRLPKNPPVIKPLEGKAQYGGTWRSAMLTQEDTQWLWYAMNYEPLVRWKPDKTGKPGYDEMEANTAEFTVDADSKVFTFKLRDGLKWSDGKPATADDMLFTILEVQCDEGLHPDGIYDAFLSPDTEKIAKIEKTDERTVTITYTAPQPSLLGQIADGIFLREGAYGMLLPKHYFQQFHLKYNKNANALAKKAGVGSWTDLFAQKQNPWTNPDQPTLAPWKVTTGLGKGSAVTLTRNPYYWKVDDAGRQLPYIDNCRVEVVQDAQVELLKVMNGEFGMQYRNFGTPQNKPVVAQNRQKGSYKIFEVPTQLTNTMVLGLNLTHKDAAKRALFSNKEFRAGLSVAINRKEIIDAVYAGQGEPWQGAPPKDSPYYNEQLATQFLDFDAAKANQHLDAAGLTKKSADGKRLGADGKPVSVAVLVSESFPDHVEAIEFVKKRWAAVGIELRTQAVSEDLYKERVKGNDHDAGTWTCGTFVLPTGTGGDHYWVPTNDGSARYGVAWAQWYQSKGEKGTKPPAEVQKQLELFTQARQEPDPDKTLELGKQVLQIAADQFYYIGVSSVPNTYGVVKNDFHNVPAQMSESVAPGIVHPEQFSMGQ
ncbi:ABC transporter substrate-binding protein [Kribbella sp. CA-245084]|uniref:ABC transporter substrate-binding protein n=1 Tax=Kribbella sp. CA-245084 TaxID=3239940 RepID=UPI003D8D4374